MRKLWVFILMASFILYLGCGSDSKNKTKSLNPNGDSELALLMREMYDDGMRSKQQLLDGKPPEVLVKYYRLHTAKATEPEKVATPKYSAFATTYETAVKIFLESNKSNRVVSYQTMIDACMNCHKNLCPGPTVKIKHLFLSEQEMALMALTKE